MKYWIKMTRCSKFYHASLTSSIPSCILVHNTTTERVALKSSYLTLVGAKPFPANQNAIHDCFGCVIQIFRIFPPTDVHQNTHRAHAQYQGLILTTWILFNPSMDMLLHLL